MNFGELIKKRRLELDYALREFCRTKDQDSAYISRLENNIILPPRNEKKLRTIAKAYEIQEGSTLWTEFFDSAAASNLTIPKDLAENNENILKFLPAFCRTVRKEKVTKEDVDDLIKLIKGENSENGES